MSSRLIVVDDTDPSIQYSGSGWFNHTGGMDEVGNFGPTYLDSLHGTNSSGSFSLSFKGTSIEVWGTNSPVNTTNGVNPTYECLVDNVKIGTTPYFQYPENNFPFCTTQQLSDRFHVLTVNANSNGPTFWFDFIRYIPSPSVSTQHAVMSVEIHDSAISYDSSWVVLGSSMSTTTTGAQMNFSFSGTALTWVSYIPTELSHNPTTATYSIDGGSLTTFSLNGLPADYPVSVYNQIFFEVSGLSSGSHTLHVVHGGNANTTPLTLMHLLVTSPSSLSLPSSGSSVSSAGSSSSSGSPSPSGSTATNTTSSTNSTNSPQSNPAPLPGVSSSGTVYNISSSASGSSATTGTVGSNTNLVSTSQRKKIGAIVGGVVGGFIFVLLIILLVFHRRRRRQRAVSLPDNHLSPFMSTPPVYSNDSFASLAPLTRSPTGQLYDAQVNTCSITESSIASGCDPQVVREQAEPPIHFVGNAVPENRGRFYQEEEIDEIDEPLPGYSPN